MADACYFLFNRYNESGHINIGTGIDVSISELGDLIKNIIGYKGDIIYDNSKPDGTPRKLLNVSKINNLGWMSTISLEDGVKRTISEVANIF